MLGLQCVSIAGASWTPQYQHKLQRCSCGMPLLESKRAWMLLNVGGAGLGAIEPPTARILRLGCLKHQFSSAAYSAASRNCWNKNVLQLLGIACCVIANCRRAFLVWTCVKSIVLGTLVAQTYQTAIQNYVAEEFWFENTTRAKEKCLSLKQLCSTKIKKTTGNEE